MAKFISNVSLAVLIAAAGLTGAANAADPVPASKKPLATAVQNQALWADFTATDAIFNRTILSGGDVAEEIKSLLKSAKNSNSSAIERAAALQLASMLQWREGDINGALKTIDKALEIGRYGELLRQKGRLLDASGKSEDAQRVYREALPLLSGETQSQVQLRLALLVADKNIEPLVALAKKSRVDTQHGRGLRNRVAVALAILGHYAEAIELFELLENASEEEQLLYHLRMAEWSLRDQDVLRAQSEAWQAVQVATTQGDRRYSLGLLTEAYRMDDTLDVLIKKLTDKKALNEDERNVWISLLRETERFDEALAAFQGKAATETPLMKRQLIGIYRESGRQAEMVTEFQRLMTVDSTDVNWPTGLAQHFLSKGDEAAAKAVWQQFIDQNSQSKPLLKGAVEMQKLSFDQLALAAAKKSQTNASAIKRSAMFRFELYLERGERDKAEEVLAELDRDLKTSDPLRKMLAEGYGRLQQSTEALRVLSAYTSKGKSLDVAGQLRLAELQMESGKTAQALEVLLTVLPIASPVQQRTVETRIIKAATALKQLDQLTEDLSRKVKENKASELESRLLIKIYADQGKGANALAVIDQYYPEEGEGGGIDSVERLNQKAKIYLLLKDYQGYDRVAKTLFVKDPDNALTHIRGVIVNYIENLSANAKSDAEIIKTLEALVEQHATVSVGGAEKEFEAGVLSMAGELDRAIEVFREIQAEQPERVDNYLTMGSLLTKTNRKDKAIALFQYLAESSTNEKLFITALDGILNTQPNKSVLEWAQRLILERLTSNSDKQIYYRQLTDMASDLGRINLQMSALENSLAIDTGLRGSTLRELVQLTNPKQSRTAVLAGKSSPNAEKNVLFSRRLLALGHKLPPNLYVDMGNALLQVGERDAAVQAVNIAVERTGQIDLLVEAGKIFAASNEDALAQVQFEKALLANPNDLELTILTAQVLERVDLKTEAYNVYLKGLLSLLGRQANQVAQIQPHKPRYGQPLTQDHVLWGAARELNAQTKLDSSKSDEYKITYAKLRDGVVRNLPTPESERKALMQGVWLAFDAELQEIANAQGNRYPGLANYPRLNTLSLFVRYLAFVTEDYDTLDRLDQSLLAQFPEDSSLPGALVAHRIEWGSQGYLQRLEDYQPELSETVKSELAKTWLNMGEKAIAPLLAVTKPSADFAALAGTEKPKVTADNLKREMVAARVANDLDQIFELSKSMVDLNQVQQALDGSEGVLDDKHLKKLAEYIAETLRSDDKRALRSLKWNFSRNSLAGQLEALLGKPLFSEQRLLQLVTENESGLKVSNVNYVYHHLTGSHRETWFQMLAREISVSTRISQNSPVQHLLKLPLSESERDLFMKAVVKSNGNSSWANSKASAAQNAPWLINADIHPNNLAMAAELAEMYRKNLGANVFKPNLLRNAGKIDEAIDAFLDLHLAGGLDEHRLEGQYRKNLLQPNLKKVMAKVAAYQPADAQQVENKVIYQSRLLMQKYKDQPQQMLNSLQSFLQENPELSGLQGVRRYVSHLQLTQGYRIEAINNMLTGIGPDDSDRVSSISKLVSLYDELDHPLKVLELQEQLQAQKKARAPIGARNDFKELFIALQRGDEELLRSQMIKVWQNVVVSEGPTTWSQRSSGSTRLNLDSVMNMTVPGQLSEAGSTRRLMLDALIEHKLSVEVLEGWLETIRGRNVEQAIPLFEYLAEAYVRHGVAEQRLSELSQMIRENRAGKKAVILWLTLAGSSEALARSADAQALVADTILDTPAFSKQQLSLLARFYVRSGRMADALNSYRSIAEVMFGEGSHSNQIVARSEQNFSARGLIKQAKKHLDQSHFDQFVEGVFALLQPSEKSMAPLFSHFVLDVLDTSNNKSGFYIRHRYAVEEALATLGVKDPGTNSKAKDNPARSLYVASLLRDVGDQERALKALQLALIRHEVVEQQLKPAGDNGRIYRSKLGKLELPSVHQFREDRRSHQAQKNGGHQMTAFDKLFPISDVKWNNSAAKWIQVWIDSGSIVRNRGVIVLLDIAKRLKIGGDTAAANEVLAQLKQQLAFRDQIAATTVASIVATASELGQPIDDLQLEQQLLTSGALQPEQFAGVIRRTAKAEGAERALQLGEEMANYSLHHPFLSELISLSSELGLQASADKWRKLQKQAQISNKQLIELKKQ